MRAHQWLVTLALFTQESSVVASPVQKNMDRRLVSLLALQFFSSALLTTRFQNESREPKSFSSWDSIFISEESRRFLDNFDTFHKMFTNHPCGAVSIILSITVYLYDAYSTMADFFGYFYPEFAILFELRSVIVYFTIYPKPMKKFWNNDNRGHPMREKRDYRKLQLLSRRDWPYSAEHWLKRISSLCFNGKLNKLDSVLLRMTFYKYSNGIIIHDL